MKLIAAELWLTARPTARHPPTGRSRAVLWRGPFGYVRRERHLTWLRARYYDGESALVHEVSVRPTTAELVIFRLADAGIVARWPVGELAVLGDTGRSRSAGGAQRLEAPAGRRSRIAAPARGLVPQLAPLVAPRGSVGRRVAAFGATLVGLVGLFWLVVDYGSEYAAPLLPYSLQAKLGESVFDELTADKDECHGKAGLAAINDLANRLARAADYPHEITVHVIEGGPVNAFTLPGGILGGLFRPYRPGRTARRWRAWWRTRSAMPCTIIR